MYKKIIGILICTLLIGISFFPIINGNRIISNIEKNYSKNYDFAFNKYKINDSF